MDQIFHLNDNQIIPLREQPYDSEEILQSLLAQFPEILGESSSEKGSRWLLIDREAGVPDAEEAAGRWAVDHLFLDTDGIPTLVEVKRSTDTRIRREVVGQMLDYAANAVAYWPLERLQTQFEKRCAGEGSPAADEIARFLGEDGDPESFWEQVGTNLRAGKIRLVFVADSIPRELVRIVEFLNEQMDPAEVLALEVHQYVGENTKTLVPRLLGRTATSETKKPPRTRKTQLTMEQLLDGFEDPAHRAAARRLIEEVKSLGMTVNVGTTGASLRYHVPGYVRPLSLGWLFPPGIIGWYGLKDLTLGHDPASSLAISANFVSPLANYTDALEAMPGSEAVPSKGLEAFRFTPNALVKVAEEVLQTLRAVVEALNAMDPNL